MINFSRYHVYNQRDVVRSKRRVTRFNLGAFSEGEGYAHLGEFYAPIPEADAATCVRAFLRQLEFVHLQSYHGRSAVHACVRPASGSRGPKTLCGKDTGGLNSVEGPATCKTCNHVKEIWK